MALGLGVLSGGSGALALNAREAHVPVVKDTESISAAPKADAEMFFRIDISPVGVHSESGRERLDIDLLMTSRHKKAIGVKYSSFVADERGRLMTQATDSPLFTINREDSNFVSKLTTPASLSDGFYRLHVVAAGTDGDETSVLTTAFSWRVTNGAITPLSDEEWYAKSGSNQAH